MHGNLWLASLTLTFALGEFLFQIMFQESFAVHNCARNLNFAVLLHIVKSKKNIFSKYGHGIPYFNGNFLQILNLIMSRRRLNVNIEDNIQNC